MIERKSQPPGQNRALLVQLKKSKELRAEANKLIAQASSHKDKIKYQRAEDDVDKLDGVKGASTRATKSKIYQNLKAVRRQSFMRQHQ